jgi:hypothetical protein
LKINDNATTPQFTAVAHSLYNCDNTQQLTCFYHACLFLPVVSTLTNVINKGYLNGFPGLTAQRVRHYIQINNTTKKGRMDQTRQGQRSTQPNPTNTSNANNLLNNNDVLPDYIDKGLTNLVFMVIHDITGLVFSDQTGRFPSRPLGDTRTLSFSTSTMQTSLRQSQSRTEQNKNSSKPTKSPTSTCQVVDSNLAFTRWTTNLKGC